MLFRINLPLFSTVFPLNSCCFCPCRPFVVITSKETELTSTPTRPVDNVITMKGLQGQKQQLFDGKTVENKG